MEGFERRALIAIIIVTLFIIGYTYYFMPASENRAPTQAKTTNRIQLQKETLKSTKKSSSQRKKERLITIDTTNYIMKISDTNGAIKELILKKYNIQEKKVTLVKSKGYYNTLETVFANKDIEQMEETLPYQTPSYKINLSRPNQTYTLTLIKKLKNTEIIKTYKFTNDQYYFTLGVKILKNGKPQHVEFSIYAGPNLGDLQKQSHSHLGAVALINNDKIETDTKIKPTETIHWIALESKYFCLAFLPTKGNSLEAGYTKLKDGNYIYANFKTPTKILIYSGPKSSETISAVDHKLDKIIRFGMFGFIGKPLLYVLNWLYSIFGNYGVAIIVLTILIRIIFYPLSFKSYKSMREMAKLQPKLKELQAKYKGKPEQLNKATMELYKKHKVNPFGGCFPMLIQIPVFFALYNVLLNAIELRGAPFILWITDLSSKDPYYVLPIIMGLTMYIQQKLTPATMDSTQQKIMMFMPIVFTIMFMGFPSGLVLYWTTNNILTILQQFIDSRILKAQEKRQKLKNAT